jgi:hypothetical protein
MMNKKAVLLSIGVMAALALMVATTLSSSADARIEDVCTAPGNSGCNDNNINSGPHDETSVNPSGHAPPGQQAPERDD